MLTFGDRVKAAREAKGLNQAQLAKECEVSSAAIISNWENNINKPDFEKIVKLCIALDVTTSYLLDYSPYDGNDLSSEEWEIIRGLRELDPDRFNIVKAALKEQLTILNQWNEGYVVITKYKIDEPVFLSKGDPEYNEIKYLCRDLNNLRKNRAQSFEDITHFLWYIGYEKNICLAYVISIFTNGRRVPNRQLYNRIRAFLEGKYSIVIDGEKGENVLWPICANTVTKAGN